MDNLNLVILDDDPADRSSATHGGDLRISKYQLPHRHKSYQIKCPRRFLNGAGQMTSSRSVYQ
jgi:hypothetical protein